MDVSIDESHHLVTEKEYISITLDAILVTYRKYAPVPWAGLDFTNQRMLTLARGLAPAHIRFGGGDADRITFYDDTDKYHKHLERVHSRINKNTSHIQVNQTNQVVKKGKSTKPVQIYPKDIDNLLKLAGLSGGKLLFDLNICPRLPNKDWDPTSALKLMKYISKKTGGEVNDVVGFELGNEWPYFDYNPPAERVGEDFIDLRKAMDTLPEYKDAWIVGPDCHGIQNSPGGWEPVLTAFTKVARNISARAVTVHHYYFSGPESTDDQYRNVEIMNTLAEAIHKAKGFMKKAGNDNIPLWIGETADAKHHGCLGKTDRFLGSFLWMDELGVAAEHGVSLLARQDFWGLNYSLVNSTYYPNPDYWVTYIYKQLVGEVVLFPTTRGSTINSTRLYAHCTSKRAGFPTGSVTFFGLNLADESSPSIHINLPSESLALYVLTSDGPLTSQGVLLNGIRLEMLEDGTRFPDIEPVTTPLQQGIQLPPVSVFYAVVPSSRIKLCM